MSKNFIQNGEVINFTNSGSAIVSGAVVVVGNLVGVALTNIGTNETGAVAIEGVFELPKATAAVIAVGEKVLWDVSAGKFDAKSATPATGDISNACAAWEAAGAGATSVKVRLNVGMGVVA